MYLEKAEVENFRGVRHLCINFEAQSSVLIGENTWGKSSFLSALYVALGMGKPACLCKNDLYVPLIMDEAPAGTADPGESPCDRPPVVRPPLDFNRALAPALELGSAKEAREEQGKDRAQASQEKGSEDPGSQEQGSEEGEDQRWIDYAKRIRQEDQSFKESDVFLAKVSSITIALTFREASRDILHQSRRLKRLGHLWQKCADGFNRVFYVIKGFEKDGVFVTEHLFYDPAGNLLKPPSDEVLQLLIDMNPVVRLRDSRFEDYSEDDLDDDNQKELLELTQRFAALQEGEGVAASDLASSLQTLNSLSGKYLSSYRHKSLKVPRLKERSRTVRDMVTRPVSIESLSVLNKALQSHEPNKEKLLLTFLVSALFIAKGDRNFDQYTRPIVILEDVEGRFHPSLLLAYWSVINSIPVQKIVTTNSSDLLTAVPLGQLRRLCRQNYDTRCYQINEAGFRPDDLRRIAFHIRMNRPGVLFARTWILVEGETEIWLVPEIAAMLGSSLMCEGIRMLEFAQCGLMPLLKLAKSLGISVFVITDGDDAGRRYAQTVRSFVPEPEKHLLCLPALDIEHFFYANGYARVYRECANLPENYNKKQYNTSRIITLAVKRQSKPGMALALLAAMQQRGPEGIPKIFKEAVHNIAQMSKDEMA